MLAAGLQVSAVGAKSLWLFVAICNAHKLCCRCRLLAPRAAVTGRLLVQRRRRLVRHLVLHGGGC